MPVVRESQGRGEKKVGNLEHIIWRKTFQSSFSHLLGVTETSSSGPAEGVLQVYVTADNRSLGEEKSQKLNFRVAHCDSHVGFCQTTLQYVGNTFIILGKKTATILPNTYKQLQFNLISLICMQFAVLFHTD